MLSKEELMNNASMFIGKGNSKTSLNKIKPNASNYVSKVGNSKANYSTAIENLVNQALRSQSIGLGSQKENLKKGKSKQKHNKSKKNIEF